MRMPIISVLAFAVSVSFSGCYLKVKSDELIGIYQMKYPYGTEELQLNKDGTYSQTILLNGEATPITNRGRWEFWEEYSKVNLKDAIISGDGFGNLEPRFWERPMNWTVGARKSFGKISLKINPDLGWSFKKIER